VKETTLQVQAPVKTIKNEAEKAPKNLTELVILNLIFLETRKRALRVV